MLYEVITPLLEDVVVERAKELHAEERRETALEQQAKLATLAHSYNFV